MGREIMPVAVALTIFCGCAGGNVADESFALVRNHKPAAVFIFGEPGLNGV